MSPSGLLTVNEGQGATSVTIQVTAILTSTTVTKQLNIRTIARTYPTQSNTSIQGEQSLAGEETTYTIQSSNEVNGKFITEWTLEGMDSYAEIKESNNTSCVIRKLNETTAAIIGTLKATIKKEYNNSQVATITKQVQIVNENIAETDPKICKVFYDAGLCAHENYITKEEARLVTDTDFKKVNRKIGDLYSFNFIGFQYFTSVITIPEYTFGYSSFHNYNIGEVVLPPSIREIEPNCIKDVLKLTINSEELHTYVNTTSSYITVPVKGGHYDDGDRTSDGYIKLPNSCSVSGGGGNNSEFIITLPKSAKFTIIGGGENMNWIPKIEQGYNYKNLFIENSIFKFVYGRSFKNISNYLVKILPTIVTTNDGGYFEDMSTTQDIVLSEVNPNVYKVENVIYYRTINITSNIEEADFTIEYTTQENQVVTTTVKRGEYILPIKYNTTLKITPLDIENYITPSAASTTLVDTKYNRSFNYAENTGLYIEHVNGTLYTKDEWTAGGFSNDDANGVAVVRAVSGNFVIAKDESSSKLAFGGYRKTITGIVTTTSTSEALLDNDGVGNTPKIIEQCNGYTSNNITGAPAAEYCANFTFPNNKKGYLGALGEWKAVYNNKTEINNILSLIGGTTLKNDYYWTSTQNDSTSNWYLTLSYDSAGSYSRVYTNNVRAFCQLSNNQNT